MHSCIDKVMARDSSLDESAAIGICCESVGGGKSLEQVLKLYKQHGGAHAGHEGAHAEPTQSQPGGGESSGGGSPGYANARQEWRMVNQRIAAGGLKRGERRLLEKRAERLAREILGVPPEGDNSMGKSRQERKVRQAQLHQLKAAQTKAELEAQTIADNIADLEIDDVGGLPIPAEEKTEPEQKDGMMGGMNIPTMQMPEMPYGGATTLADALAAMDADEQSEALHEAISLFQTVTSNILCDMMIDDKGAAIGAAAKELQKLLNDPSPLMKEITAEAPEGKAQKKESEVGFMAWLKAQWEAFKAGSGNKSVADARKALTAAMELHQGHIDGTEPTSKSSQAKLMALIKQALVELPTSEKAGARHSASDQDHIQQAHDHLSMAGAACEMKVMKGIDGQYYAFGYATNNFRDRDFAKHPKGEVITEAAHKEFAAYLDAQPDQAPEFWCWHTPGSARKERAVWWDYADGFMCYLWPLTPEEVKGFDEGESVAMSHGFYVLERNAKEGTIDKYRSFEGSDLPPEAAANPYTDLEIMRKESTMFDEKKKAYLTKRLGPEKVKELEAHPAEMAKALAALGVEQKAQDGAPAILAPEAIIEDLKKALNVEGLNQIITELQAQTKAQADQITALTAQQVEYKKSDDEKIAAALTPKAGPMQWGHVATKAEGNKVPEDKLAEKGIPGGAGSWMGKLMEGAS